MTPESLNEMRQEVLQAFVESVAKHVPSHPGLENANEIQGAFYCQALEHLMGCVLTALHPTKRWQIQHKIGKNALMIAEQADKFLKQHKEAAPV